MDQSLQKLEVSRFVANTIENLVDTIQSEVREIRATLKRLKAKELRAGAYLDDWYRRIYAELEHTKRVLQACCETGPLGSVVQRTPEEVEDLQFVLHSHGVRDLLELDRLLRTSNIRENQLKELVSERDEEIRQRDAQIAELLAKRVLPRRAANSKSYRAEKDSEGEDGDGSDDDPTYTLPEDQEGGRQSDENEAPGERAEGQRIMEEVLSSSGSIATLELGLPSLVVDENRPVSLKSSETERSVLILEPEKGNENSEESELRKDMKALQEMMANLTSQFATFRTSLSSAPPETQTTPSPSTVQTSASTSLVSRESYAARADYFAMLRELPELEKYGSTVGQKFSEHLTAFHERYPSQFWSDSQLKQCFMKTLADGALDTFKSCTGTFTECLAKFESIIKKVNGTRRTQAIDQYEKLSLRGSNLVTYCRELERLHRFIHPKDPVANSRTLARKLAVEIDAWKGSEEIRLLFHAHNDEDIYERVKIWASTQSEMCSPSSESKQHVSRPSSTSTSEKKTRFEKSSVNSKESRSFNSGTTSTDPSGNRERKPITCYACHKEGHKSNACPSKAVQAAVHEIEQAPRHIADLPVETVRVCERDEEALIDSGAQISVLPRWLFNQWKAEGVEIERFKQKTIDRCIRIRGIIPQAQLVEQWIGLTVRLLKTGREAVVSFAIVDTHVERIIIGHDAFKELGVALSFQEPKEAVIQRRCVLLPHSHKSVNIIGAHSSQSTLLSENRFIPDLQGVDGSASINVYNNSNETIVLDKNQVMGVWEVCEDKGKVVMPVEYTKASTGEEGPIDQRLGCTHMPEIRDVVLRHESIFTATADAPSLMKVPPADIEVENAAPRAQKVRPVPIAIQSELVKQLREMESNGITEKSCSPWASPLVLVRKKDGSLRICVDYRIVNKAICKDRYPLPNAELLLQRLSGYAFFSTFDCLSGFHQIPLSAEARPVTAFITPIGLYQFTRLPFGMANSPAVFQRCIDHVLNTTGLWNTEIFAYMDDLVVGTRTIERHAEVLEILFTTLASFGVVLRADKSQISRSSIKFLGHVISDQGVEQDLSKTEAIVNFPKPKNMAELRTFLGMMTYYRKFVMNFAAVATPLYSLTSTKSVWNWNEEHQMAFEALKEKLSTAPILHQPDIESARSGQFPFIIYTDASTRGTGAVLCQESSDHKLHPIAFTSKGLDKHQQRYHITDLEALAVLRALERFHCFVYGVEVVIRTDHLPLLAVVRTQSPSNRLLRWVLQFRRYDLKIEYIKGKLNVVADALSRGATTATHPEPNDTAYLSEDMIVASITEITVHTWLESLRKDVEFGAIIRELERGRVQYVKIRESTDTYAIIGDILCKVDKDGSKTIVVPQENREEVMEKLHNNVWVGHFGPKKLLRTLRVEYFWPGMATDVVRWHKTCVACYLNNYSKDNTPPLKPIVASKPFEIVGLDLLDLNKSHNGFRYCLTVVDYFSKWAELYPLKSKEAEEVLKAFAERWVGYGCRIPKRIISDNGKEFANQQFQSLLRWFSIDWSPSEAYNPRQNGLAERTQQTIVGLMRKSDCTVASWDTKLPMILHAYNTTVHSSTGFSPFEVLHGYPPPVTVAQDYADSRDQGYVVDYADYVRELKEVLTHLHKETYLNVRKSTRKQKLHYDKHHEVMKSTVFKEGDIVLVKRLKTSKMQNNFLGPFKILALKRTIAILQKSDKANELMKAPLDQLIPYNDFAQVNVIYMNHCSCADPRFVCSEPTCATQESLKEVCMGVVTVPPSLQNQNMPPPVHLAKILEMLDNGTSNEDMIKELSRNTEELKITKEYLAVALGLHRERCIHAIRDAADVNARFDAIANLSSSDVLWSVQNALIGIQKKRDHFKNLVPTMSEEASFIILPPEYHLIGKANPNIYVMSTNEMIRRAAHKISKATSIPRLIVVAPVKNNPEDYVKFIDRLQFVAFISEKRIPKIVLILPPAKLSTYEAVVKALQVECRLIIGTLLSLGPTCDLQLVGPTSVEDIKVYHPQGCLGLAEAMEEKPFTVAQLKQMKIALDKQMRPFSIKLPDDFPRAENRAHDKRESRHRDDVRDREGMSGLCPKDTRRAQTHTITKSDRKPKRINIRGRLH